MAREGPCLFGCPTKRANGRKVIRTWPDEPIDGDRPFSAQMGWLVTCYPAVVREEEADG